MLHLFGMSVFIFIFGGMLWSNSRRWRYMSKSYAVAPKDPVEKRFMQSVVLIGLGGFNSLKGIVTIGAAEAGVSMTILPPFSLFHEPLFIPYDDISGWETSWYLNAPSTELELRRAPDVKLIIPTELAEWIRSRAGYKMVIHDISQPSGRAGRGWRGFAIVHAALGVVVIALMLWSVLTGQKI